MWKADEKKAEKKKILRQDASLRSGENAPLQEMEETGGAGLSFENMRISYSPASSPADEAPDRGVIQLKQTTPLAERLREQGISADDLDAEIKKLIEAYDSLANDNSTKTSQQNYLYLLLDRLHTELASETSGVSGIRAAGIRTALKIVQDELSFVNVQRFDAPLAPPADAWEHMDRSPFFRMIGDMTRMERPTASVPDMPSQENFSALGAVAALNRHHIAALNVLGKIPVPALTTKEKIGHGLLSLLGRPVPSEQERRKEAFVTVHRKIIDLLLSGGMLSHYSHNPNLTVLHSTNYLKANQILSREKLEKGTAVGETENVSKSMDVDTDDFCNTGFLFFFLERAGSSHRRGTGFGKYRYTVLLREDPGILDNSWAILHDMAGASSPARGIRRDSPVQRIIQGPSDPGGALVSWKQTFEGLPSSPSSGSKIPGMLAMFLPTADQKFLLRTPDGKQHDTGIEDHMSGNFLQGTDIINGIALRAAHELLTLQNCSEQEYKFLMGNDNALWEYVAGIIHDMQIMVPRDVLPRQYDFEEDGKIRLRDTGTASAPSHISASSDSENLARLLRPERDPSVNNCFFEAMFPLIDHEGLGVANAVELRGLFNRRLTEREAAPLPAGEPAEYEHVQQFANIFNAAITVIAIDTAGNPVIIDFIPDDGGNGAHYYIRFLAPPHEGGIGHYTGL